VTAEVKVPLCTGTVNRLSQCGLAARSQCRRGLQRGAARAFYFPELPAHSSVRLY
jgi:hypothetical protein